MKAGSIKADSAAAARFEDNEAYAQKLDEGDTLAPYRTRFAIPKQAGGDDTVYLCGNSLGLMPETARDAVVAVLDDWAQLGVGAHVDAEYSWVPYQEFLQQSLARLLGAKPAEVVAMNSLTVNLHLMMVSFYRPTAKRHKIVIEKGAFPSDRHAVVSQLQFHGFDPAESLVELAPEHGESTVNEAAIEAWLQQFGDEVALVLWPGVQYYTGQYFDLPRIARAARRAGANTGFDLAHAIGNVALELHDSDCDFAVWCSYKYLNAGPGAAAGCFVHERHFNQTLPRFNGWWGHAPESRFLMQPQFQPASGADAWALSNPGILGMAPLRASLTLFDEAGIEALRDKSVRLTGYLAFLLQSRLENEIEILTPSDAARRGCQLSVRIKTGPGRQVFERLKAQGIVCDWREPDVIRVAPTPLYNCFQDALVFATGLQNALHAE